MSLNNIKLSPSLLETLYPDTLVVISKNTNSGTNFQTRSSSHSENSHHKNRVSDYRWLGNNEKNILIMVNQAHTDYLPDKELEFLISVLAACKLSLNDVTIINHNTHRTSDWKEITAYFQTKLVLLFDIEPAAWGLPLNFPMYQIQNFNQITFLYAPSLHAISADPVEKSKLWICLKKLFFNK